MDYPLTRRALAACDVAKKLLNGTATDEDLALLRDAPGVVEAFMQEKPAHIPDSPSYTVEYVRWFLTGRSW